MLDASVFFFGSILTGTFWGFGRGIGCGSSDSQTVLALVLRFQLIRRRYPDFPGDFSRKAGVEDEVAKGIM